MSELPVKPVWIAISIHSLRMEGDPHTAVPSADHRISIHSLRMEGDDGGSSEKLPSMLFQSTPSAWRETVQLQALCVGHFCISIHSLRMEGDG